VARTRLTLCESCSMIKSGKRRNSVVLNATKPAIELVISSE